MTSKPKITWPQVIAFLQHRMTIIAMVVGVLLVGFRTVWPWVKDDLRHELHVFIGLDQLVTRAEFEALVRRLDEITGADGVVEWNTNLSYLLTPVYLDDDTVTVHWELRRTERGASCVFQSGTGIFRDERNIGRSGPIVSAPIQIGTDWIPLESEMRLPSELMPGRISIVQQLIYECDGTREIDQIGPVYGTLEVRED